VADFAVLISGETGTGKSLLARILHSSGHRGRQAFVTLFCPSLESGMVETDLFGHVRGAFTGAESDRVGKVQVADGGTLFLDEVGELPLAIQPKLLRLLHEKTFERVGDPTERRADVRIVAATNKDLRAEVDAGRFRRDLYERLNFIPIHVPPLRERREDIPQLLRHCLDRSEAGRWIDVSDQALDHLVSLDYSWPGNVRELEQLVARLSMDSHAGPVPMETMRHAMEQMTRDGWSEGEASTSALPALENGLHAYLADIERGVLERILAEHPNLTRAQIATRLKISERALYKKLRLFRLT
jgi:transcriptional regulator with GAF, ATPase, and Fis domain